jgi:hypothetical protein
MDHSCATEAHKQCTACQQRLPLTSFSGAQLKKQGKRVCKACTARTHPRPIAKMPPRSIPLADCLTEQEIVRTLPRLIAQVQRVSSDSEKFPVPGNMDLRYFTFVCSLYPPSAQHPWWDDGADDGSAATGADAAMTLFKFAMWQLVNWASDVYNAKAAADPPLNDAKRPHAGARFASLPIYTGQTIFEDESRLIHKLLTYWIYYVRHCSPSCKTDEDRQHEDVTHQDYGQQGHRARIQQLWQCGLHARSHADPIPCLAPALLDTEQADCRSRLCRR